MRTRTRLLLAFLGVYLVLAAVTGALVVLVMEGSLRDAAEQRVVGVLDAGGFSLSPEVVQRMEALTGYRIRVLADDAAVPDGSFLIRHSGTSLAVDHRTAEYRNLQQAVFSGTALTLVLGVVIFAVVAWWLARQFAQPLETLAGAARIIGGGDLDAAVPTVGSGEVRDLAGDLEQMRSRLRDLDRQRREAERLATLGLFTATIAHEVRNPLSAVRLTVQMLARRHGEDPGLTLISEELERLDLIIDELLAFSKGISIRRERVDLRALADRVLQLLRRQAEHAGVDLIVEGQAQADLDPARIQQLLLNLILNAIQAQSGGGEVHVVVSAESLRVEDAGPGVAPEVLTRLFEPFASTKAEGTGLGLHLARAIAKAHGSDLRYERVGERSVFSMRLR